MTPLSAERLARQHLVGPGLGTPEAVVGWLGAVQAQDAAGATWAVALRAGSLTAATVDAVLNAGALVRTHVLRPTWHLVRPADLRWMQALTAGRVRRLLAAVDRRLEIDGPLLARAHAVVAEALAGGRHRTRAELAASLASAGIEARGQRLVHLLMHAELNALVCSGVRRGRYQTYALVDERLAPAPERTGDDALATLAAMYFRSHGPATPHDFAWWSGLTVREARHALDLLGTDAEPRDIDGVRYWTVGAMPCPRPEAPPVHLLPNYDELVVAYRDHGPSVDPGAPGALRGWGNGSTPHQITRGGLVAGGWRRTHQPDGTDLRSTLFVPFSDTEHVLLREAAEAYGRHLGRHVALSVADALAG